MLHVSLLVLGMGGILLGLVTGLMYLWQHARLKHRQGTQPGLALPSLERMERFSRLAMLVSVPLLTFGMVLGAGLVLTSGERGGNVAVRPNEAERGARFLGLNSVRVMTFKDTCLKEQTIELVQTIEETVKLLNPDIIFTHSANDQHQDHQAVHEATLRAARNHSAILCYESPSVTKSFQPALFVDINNYVDIKIASIKEHRDQRTKPYMTPERVRGVAVFRGGQAKIRYAEGFEVVRVLASALGDI